MRGCSWQILMKVEFFEKNNFNEVFLIKEEYII